VVVKRKLLENHKLIKHQTGYEFLDGYEHTEKLPSPEDPGWYALIRGVWHPVEDDKEYEPNTLFRRKLVTLADYQLEAGKLYFNEKLNILVDVKQSRFDKYTSTNRLPGLVFAHIPTLFKDRSQWEEVHRDSDLAAAFKVEGSRLLTVNLQVDKPLDRLDVEFKVADGEEPTNKLYHATVVTSTWHHTKCGKCDSFWAMEDLKETRHGWCPHCGALNNIVIKEKTNVG
jgi:DNA-directed RNA polymerase subunit RPC12/RpoP